MGKEKSDLITDLALDDGSLVKTVKNCGVGFLNIRYSYFEIGEFVNQFDSLKIDSDEFGIQQGILCGACAPGYKPIYKADKNFFVIECSEIFHCDFDQSFNLWFNSCSRCNRGYVYKFAEDKIDYTNCIENQTEFCFSFDPEEKICKKCEKGYFLNKDFNCDKIRASGCLLDCFTFKNEFKNNIGYNL